MKTSKRFLSIVLMLAMLVSMFTVMAFAGADDAQAQCNNPGEEGRNIVHYDDGKWVGGKDYHAATCQEEGNYWYKQCEYCGRWCWRNGTDDSNTEGWYTVLTEAEAAQGAKIEKKPHKLTHHDATETIREYWQCSGCDKFFADANATQELTEEGLQKPTPGYEANKTIELTIAVVPNTVENAKVMLAGTGTQVPTGQSISIWPDMLDSFTFDASADGDYTVSWKLDNNVVSTDKSYKLPNDLKAGDHTLTVTFEKKTTPVEEKYPLTVVVETVSGVTYGTVKYNGNQGTVLTDSLVAGTKVTAEAVAKSGYKFVKWVADGVTLTNTEKEKLTFKMPENEVKVTAVFTEKSSSSHTHKWVDKFNDTYHWKECSRCGDKTGKEKHTYIYAYDNYGYRYEKCKYCNWTSDYSYNHSSSHKDYTYEDINATYHWKTCKDCSYSVKEYHTWIKNPDRKTRDSYPYVCKYCDRLSKTAYTDLPFRDVDGNVWYYDDVLYAYINGYMDGLSAVEFGANQNTTRAQIVTILWRLTGEPRAMKSNKFNDVSSAAYYDKAVSWAVEAGVVNGFDAKTFKPNDYVTREQLAAILYRYAEYMNLSTRGASNLTKYDDYYQIGTWARDAMAWANYHGLINGVSYTRIDPKGLATRAQVAAILHRFAVEFGNY